jgi:hypothetical protein
MMILYLVNDNFISKKKKIPSILQDLSFHAAIARKEEDMGVMKQSNQPLGTAKNYTKNLYRYFYP